VRSAHVVLEVGINTDFFFLPVGDFPVAGATYLNDSDGVGRLPDDVRVVVLHVIDRSHPRVPFYHVFTYDRRAFRLVRAPWRFRLPARCHQNFVMHESRELIMPLLVIREVQTRAARRDVVNGFGR